MKKEAKHLGKVKMGKDVVALHLIAYVFCGVMAIVCLVPFLMVVSGSVSSEASIADFGFSIWPHEFSWEAYGTVFKEPMVIVRAYGVTIGLDDYDMENVEASAGYLMQGNIPYEFRTTVVREFHKRDDFEAIGRWLAGAEKYYLQAFEDSGDLIRPGLRAYTKEIMDQALDIVRRYVPNAELRGI